MSRSRAADQRQLLEQLPLIGGWLRDNEVGERVQESVRELPDQFTDERVAELASTLVSGVASVAIVTVLAIAVLIDGEDLLARFRRLLPAPAGAGGRDRRDHLPTLGRYFGGSITVAVLMGLYVLTLGLVLGIPLAPLAALWAMLTDLIPQVGGFLGGSFLVLLAVTEGVTPALIAGVAFVAYMNLENHIIQPAIVGRSVDLTPRRRWSRRSSAGRSPASPAHWSPPRSSARRRPSTSKHGAGRDAEDDGGQRPARPSPWAAARDRER